MIGHWHTVVLDCPDPQALATFYKQLLGLRRMDDDDDWVTLRGADDGPDPPSSGLPDTGHPSGRTAPSRSRCTDVQVDDPDAAEEAVVRLGPRKLPGGGRSLRVYADPAGHPFCVEA